MVVPVAIPFALTEACSYRMLKLTRKNFVFAVQQFEPAVSMLCEPHRKAVTKKASSLRSRGIG
ncbi:hypothetical protein GA0061105_12810 [Rhizobium aethiopicum]|uniref:Uncharacterized protein n=1 Tax=Rhizobium aethiopicum TaxID=1138170 RepID=A0A1C3YBR1_9HYPH|nr:hypothetical protein GA0061105_12810 [Rhizobium aethiopicum]